MLNVYTNAYYSPHRADFSKSPWPHDFSHPAKLPALFGDSQATGFCCGCPREKTCARLQLVWVTSYLYLHACVWFGNKNPNLFYWRTNNATKWYINLTTVDSYVHFTVDAIMYMYVNNLTGHWFSIYKVENEKFRAVWTVPIWRVINGKCAMNRLACEYLSYT